ncbi:MAG: HDIG domain-containing protein [Deltaproteobacteria bacterium]|nr:HDIG domain-containing protein [Deltaproteobacteria bacterium]
MGNNPSLIKRPYRLEGLRLLLLILMSLIISMFLFPDIFERPRTYNLGDVSQEDIKATRDLLIENDELTEKNREEAAAAVPSVYDIDPDASDLVLRLQEAMSEARDVFFPESAEEAVPALQVDKKTLEAQKKEQQALAQEQFFQTLEISPDQKIFNELIKAEFAAGIEENVSELLTEVLNKGVVGNTMVLMSQQQKGITLVNLENLDQTLVTDFSRFYSIEGAKNYIKSRREEIREKTESSVYANASVNLASLLVRINVTPDSRETQLRKELAREAVKPSFYQVKTGEMIVREGELIEAEHLVKLTAENKLIEEKNTLRRAPGMAALLAIFFIVIYISGSIRFKSHANEDRQLIFFVTTLVVMFLLTWVYNFIAEDISRGFRSLSDNTLLFALPIACGSMLIAIFQGIGMAFVFSMIISILSSLVTQGGDEFFIYYFASSLFAAHWVKDYRQRGILIRTGAKVGLINILLCLSMEINNGTLFSIESIVAVIAGFLGGILAGVITTGIIPLVEMSFGFTTDLKLLELANLDQPLLRELMVQAPGTYHHSVIVSSMAEASAKAINANPLLAKVAAYYHDIGKMKKPLYFIENQMGGENRHDKLAPSLSSLIILSHVKDGVELAKKHKLNREIIDIIEQHQGTKLITYFYEKAKEQAASRGSKSANIKEEDYRYPGPKPQTKEAGLIMLADMVEAATRALSDPSPARVQGTVQKIINKVFADGQLDECEITLKDLHLIAKSFNVTLSGIFHYRIEYPDSTLKNMKKADNGDTDHIQEEDAGGKFPGNKKDDEKGLRRLGL